MPRPSILPKNERNGFYIEVKNKGKATGMKLRSETKEAMLENAKLNKLYKDVIILYSILHQWHLLLIARFLLFFVSNHQSLSDNSLSFPLSSVEY